MKIWLLGHNAGKKPASTPVMTNWDQSPPVSRQSTPFSPIIQAPAAPPGLPPRKNAWGSSATSYPTHSPALAVPGKTAASVTQDAPDRAINMSWGSAGASTSSPDSDSGPDLTTATESDNPYAVHIHFSESMEEEFHGMGIRALEDEGELLELDSIAPTWDEPTGPTPWEANPTGWEEGPLDAEDLWRQNQEVPKPVLCKAHGIICKKGICAEYARQLRFTKRAEEAEKRKVAIANKGKKGGRTKGRGMAKNDDNESTGRNATHNNQFHGPGAPVKTNWRGAPRAIVTADAIEKRETANAASDGGWGNSDSERESNPAAVVSTGPADTASNASWGISENAYDPWLTSEKPAMKANLPGGKPQGRKKPGQTTVSSSWADQVDAELAAGNDEDAFSIVSSKRSAKRGGSTASWRTTATSSAAKWSRG